MFPLHTARRLRIIKIPCISPLLELVESLRTTEGSCIIDIRIRKISPLFPVLFGSNLTTPPRTPGRDDTHIDEQCRVQRAE